MTDGLRTWISPISPGGRTAPVSRSATRSSTPVGRQPGGVEPPGRRVVDRIDGDDRHLAGPVGREPAHPGALGDRSAATLLAHRRRPPHDVAQRRQVEVLEVGVVGHGQRDRRHRHLEGHPLGLDAVQHLVEVEATMQPHGGAGRRRRQQVQQAEDVRRGRGHLEPVVRTQAEGLAPVRGGAAHRPVGVADRLREPGGPRAEHQHRLVRRRPPPAVGPAGVGPPATVDRRRVGRDR